jgi:hypothetical protein
MRLPEAHETVSFLQLGHIPAIIRKADITE